GAIKFELLSLSFRVVRQQRQLVQPFLKLRGRFHDRRPGDGPMTGLAPIKDGFLNKPSFTVMAREKLRLAVDHLGGKSFERFGDPPVQFVSGSAQQAAISGVLHKRMLEGIDRIGWRTMLKY